MVADTAADIVVHMEFDMMANQEVDMVADMVAGRGCWLIGSKLFRLEHYLTCEFICNAFSKCIVVPSKSDTRRRCLVNMM